MRALITGGHGFVGRHLAQHLVSCGDDVAVTYNPAEKGQIQEVFQTALPRSAQSLAMDICNAQAVEEVIALLRPDAVYHLAARTFVPEAENEFRRVFEVNTFGTVHLFEAIAKHSKSTKVLFVSSSEVYGEPRPGTLPLQETAVMRPITAYGVTKSAADLAAHKYAFRDGVEAIRVRPFPHIGPGQSDVFAISSFARQVAEIKLKRREPTIRVGNLEVKRDYSDVSDIVRGYREALLNGKKGEVYNLCSGASIAIGELLQKLLKVAEVDAEIVVDPARVRPVDIIDMYGSNQKAFKEFGWKPRIDLEGTLHSILAFWLEALDKA
jgi:GDP-4-dehydro-6-deoxy-D-mannose reductase